MRLLGREAGQDRRRSPDCKCTQARLHSIFYYCFHHMCSSIPSRTFANHYPDRMVPSTDLARAAHPSRLLATQQLINLAPKPTQAPSTRVYELSIVQASLAVDGRKRVFHSSPSLVPFGACHLGRHQRAPMALMPTARRRATVQAKQSLLVAARCQATRKVTVAIPAIPP